MSSARPPLVTIGNVPLDLDRFSWPLRVGALSGSTTIDVHAADHGPELERMMLALQPVDVLIQSDVWPTHQGEVADRTIRITRVYVTEEMQSESRYRRRFRLNDWRYLLEDELTTHAYNVRRRLNAPRSVEGKRFEANLPGGSPADFETVSQFRYLPHSLREPNGPTHLTDFSDRGKVWVAGEIMRNLLLEYARVGQVDLSRLKEAGYQPENLEWEGQSLPGALNSAFAMARHSCFVRPDTGALVVFPVTDSSPEQLAKVFPPPFPSQGSGWPIVDNKRATRAGKVRNQFVREHEILWKFEEEDDGGETQAAVPIPPFMLQNVLQLPEDVGGRKKGEWVTFAEAFALWNADAENPLSGDFLAFGTWSLAQVRNSYLTSRLQFFAFDTRFPSFGNMNPVILGRVHAVKSHFRQTYRILPAWMDRIQSWRPELVSVVDQVTNQRATAAVFQDYCVAPTLKVFAIPGQAQRALEQGSNITGYSDTVENATRVPATIAVIDHDLGIFRVHFYDDLKHNYGDIIPSRVDNIPKVAWHEIGQRLWEDARLSPTHKVAVLCSVIFNVPNGEGRLYTVDVGPKEVGSEEGNPALTKEILSRRSTAAYRWTDQSKARLTADGVEITGSELDNREIVEAIAKAETERYYFGLRNRPKGTYSLTGWEGEDFFPAGNVRQVTIVFERGRIDTGIDITEPPEARSLMEILPASVRRFLYRQIPRD